jgi:hypothetical protein
MAGTTSNWEDNLGGQESAVRENPHAAFDVAGAGIGARSKWCDTRRRKGEPAGNTNIDLNCASCGRHDRA